MDDREINMDKRPRSITIIGWLFIVFGTISLLSGLLPFGDVTLAQRIAELKGHWMVHVVRLASIVSGMFMLYGFNWARWLLVAWMAFHIVVSALHSLLQLLIHVSIFSVILYFLFQRQASAYFVRQKA
jgi:hypothetical protein